MVDTLGPALLSDGAAPGAGTAPVALTVTITVTLSA